MRKALLVYISLIMCLALTSCGSVMNLADAFLPADTVKAISGIESNTQNTDTRAPAVSAERNKPKYQVTSRTVILDNKVPENLKEDYIIFCNALEEQAEKIDFYSDITKSLDILIYYVSSYNPHLYYVDWREISYATKSLDNVVKQTTITVKYKNNRSEADLQKLEKKVGDIINEADKKENLFKKELYVHDYLVENIEYDMNTEHAGDIYGALIEGKAKCDGYSKAFQYIMNRIGIETVLITGNTGEKHMWNMVGLENKYYFVDVTHDDPVYSPGETFYGENKAEHSCFNVPERILSSTHKIDPVNSDPDKGSVSNLDLQQCNSLDHNYYIVKNMAVSDLEEFGKLLVMNKEAADTEVFFTENMPSYDEIINTFKYFMKGQYSGSGYKFYYTSQSDDSYKHNVFRISWEVN